MTTLPPYNPRDVHVSRLGEDLAAMCARPPRSAEPVRPLDLVPCLRGITSFEADLEGLFNMETSSATRARGRVRLLGDELRRVRESGFTGTGVAYFAAKR